jgi:hypothetical protein
MVGRVFLCVFAACCALLLCLLWCAVFLCDPSLSKFCKDAAGVPLKPNLLFAMPASEVDGLLLWSGPAHVRLHCGRCHACRLVVLRTSWASSMGLQHFSRVPLGNVKSDIGYPHADTLDAISSLEAMQSKCFTEALVFCLVLACRVLKLSRVV